MQAPFKDKPAVKDYFHKEHTIETRDDLYNLYVVDSQAQVDKYNEQFSGDFKPDGYLEWMLKRKICPKGVISSQSMYLLEQIMLLDGEMGLTLPCPMDELPALFLQALRIIREVRAEGKENG